MAATTRSAEAAAAHTFAHLVADLERRRLGSAQPLSAPAASAHAE